LLTSLILPTHNRAALLPRAVQSVLNQTVRSWELIIVDDGSTDNTREVGASFARDPRIRYHYQDNRQLNGARNTGVALATGEYIGFLDDDDEFLPNHLEVLKQTIQDDNGQHDIYRSGEILRRGEKDSLAHNYQNGQDILPQYWQHVTGMFGMLISAEVIKGYTFNEDHLLLDDFYWLNQVLLSANLYQIDAHTAVVNLHPDQRSTTYLTDKLLEQNISRLAQAYNIPGVPERVPFESYRQQIVHQYLHYSRQLARDGQRLKALKTWKESLSYTRAQNTRELMRTLVMIGTGR
jgi:glycosyltransferase involved in cell wall biosynthesis